ncbi:hypothetical protein D9M71_767410 [compost metagenome]
MALGAVAGAATAFARAGLHGLVAPGAADLEGLVEFGHEMQRVVTLAAILGQVAAEVAGGDGAAHGARVRIDHDA